MQALPDRNAVERVQDVFEQPHARIIPLRDAVVGIILKPSGVIVGQHPVPFSARRSVLFGPDFEDLLGAP